MNKEIAFILKEKLSEALLPFVSKYYGLVELVLEPVEGEFNTTIVKRLPVATELTYITEADETVCLSREEIAVPDSGLKGIIYFEDGGTKIVSYGSRTDYVSRLDLVCWINVARVKEDSYERIEPSAITMILEAIRNGNNFENIRDFQRFKVKPILIKPRSANVFSKYTYDEAHSQYLRPPFTYFAIALDVSYSMNSDCLGNFETINGEICY